MPKRGKQRDIAPALHLQVAISLAAMRLNPRQMLRQLGQRVAELGATKHQPVRVHRVLGGEAVVGGVSL